MDFFFLFAHLLHSICHTLLIHCSLDFPGITSFPGGQRNLWITALHPLPTQSIKLLGTFPTHNEEWILTIHSFYRPSYLIFKWKVWVLGNHIKLLKQHISIACIILSIFFNLSKKRVGKETERNHLAANSLILSSSPHFKI